MAQYDFGTINANTKSGTGLASDLNDWRDALHSMHIGSSAPSYIAAGMMWIDNSAAPWVLYVYDGTDNIPVALFDTTGNLSRVLVDNDRDSYAGYSADDVMTFVIAATERLKVYASGINVTGDIYENNRPIASVVTELVSTSSVASVASSQVGSGGSGYTNMRILVKYTVPVTDGDVLALRLGAGGTAIASTDYTFSISTQDSTTITSIRSTGQGLFSIMPTGVSNSATSASAVIDILHMNSGTAYPTVHYTSQYRNASGAQVVTRGSGVLGLTTLVDQAFLLYVGGNIASIAATFSEVR